MERNERIKAIAAELWKVSTDEQSEVYSKWYATELTQDDIEKALTEYASRNDWSNMKFIERNDNVSRERYLGKGWELDGDIDKIQLFLKDLKNEGYSEIKEKWSDYDDNYFVAIKYECEVDDEYYGRLQKELTPYLRAIEYNKSRIVEKKKRIEELEKEIEKLKKEIE